VYSVSEALEVIKKLPKRKFRESIDIAVNLGVDPRKSDQSCAWLYRVTKRYGKTIRHCSDYLSRTRRSATKRGADIVGLDDLAEQVKAGKIDFDILLATPDLCGS